MSIPAVLLRSVPVCYSLALVLTAAITLLRFALDPYLADNSIYSFYYASVIIAAWYLGLGPSILNIVAAVAAAAYFFASPRFSWAIHESRHVRGLLLFIIVSGYLAYLITWLKRDIARRQKVEADLIATQELVQAHQAELAHMARLTLMGEMSASLAHELNQPLHSARNYAQGSIRRMQKDPGSDREVIAALEKISSESDRAANILRKVRNFVDKAMPEIARIALGELLQDAMTMVNMGPKSNRTRVVFDLPADLPDVLGDRVEIEQVLVNLGRNAVESMCEVPDEERVLRVGARRCDKKMVEVQLRDCGSGICAEDLPRVFEPFFSTKADGMGMGLAISRSIVERQEGRLWVTANDDRGCTFHFTLPCEET